MTDIERADDIALQVANGEITEQDGINTLVNYCGFSLERATKFVSADGE